MPQTKIPRWWPSVWKETRSLTKTVPGGGAGEGNSSGSWESGFMGVSMPDRSARGKTKSQRPETRETQKADRFWFAPGAAKKAGQWRVLTRRCCNHDGLFPQLLK